MDSPTEHSEKGDERRLSSADRGNKHRLLFENILTAALSAVLLGAVAVSLIRSHGKLWFPPSRLAPTKADALEWSKAVETGNKIMSIALAERLSTAEPPELPDSDYLLLLDQSRISTAALTSPYNNFDFIRWKDALRARQILQNIASKNNGGVSPEILCRQALDGLEIAPLSEKPAPTICDIADKKRVSTAEACRLLAALARQAGYQAWVVVAANPEGKPPTLLCEIRGDGKVATINTKTKIICDKPAETALADLRPKPAGVVRLLPSEMMDYKLAEQRLAKKLSKLLPAKYPKFGADPRSVIDAFVKSSPRGKPATPISYWHFPFLSLKSSPYFPEEWKLPPPGLMKRTTTK